MTNKEAIKVIKHLYEANPIEEEEALNLAIKALKEQRPQGKWIVEKDVYCKCPFCGYKDVKYSNYCPSCGAKMGKPQTQKLVNNSQELVKDLVKDNNVKGDKE